MKRKEPKFKFHNVMLIDDSELDNFINEKTLEANHFAERVYSSTSSKSAMEFLKNLTTLGESGAYPEVIFVDLNMPMIDGFQFIRHFKENNEKKLNEPKLVILTSSLNHDDENMAREISEDILFLNKPLTSEMLENIGAN
jgi:CheY-like chemotaxis protein